MSAGSYATTYSDTFTVTHARHIAIKIATDLKRLQRFHGGRPPDSEIDDYEREVVALLRHDYMNFVTYGFRYQGKGQYVVALKYLAQQGVGLLDDSPGRIPIGVDTRGCFFHSFLSYSSRWGMLSKVQQGEFYRQSGIVLRRNAGTEPGGHWGNIDKTYSAGGRAMSRCTVG